MLTLLDGGPVAKAEADRIRQLISKTGREEIMNRFHEFGIIILRRSR